MTVVESGMIGSGLVALLPLSFCAGFKYSCLPSRLGVRAADETGGAALFPLPKYEELRGILVGKLMVAAVSGFREGLYMASGAFGMPGISVSRGNRFERGAEVGTEGISLGPKGRILVGNAVD
jgi:hypothetical protein